MQIILYSLFHNPCMEHKEVLAQTEAYVRQTLEGECTGHDWWHIDRVRNTACAIAREEHADLYIVELGALLHDIADWKFHGGDESAGVQKARAWLKSLSVDSHIIDAVIHVIEHVSFKGAGVASQMQSIEGTCVQDADRLDALGAIGIARCFAYGGSKGRALYNPEQTPIMHASFEAYKNNTSSSVHHFYEKILLLKDRMNTHAGRRIAEQRHAFLEKYLQQFHAEWNGER